MNSTKESTSALNTKSPLQQKPSGAQYVKVSKTGFIYHVIPVDKNQKDVYLRYKNSYTKYALRDIKQGIVDGKYVEPNEHEVKKFLDRDAVYFQQLTYKLLKRVMYTQLLLDLDSELMEDFSDDKYMRNILEKSEKQFMRMVKETYPKMYAIDKDMLFTFMNSIDSFINKLAKVLPHQFMFMHVAIDRYFEDPESFVPDNVEIVKIDE